MNKTIDKKILIKIKSVIFKYIKDNDQHFFLFGSRVDGTAKIKSDYDIGFISDKKIDPIIKSNILDAFDRIPALIDLVDFSNVNEKFKKESMKNIIWLNR